ncbi:16S rRNA (guanine(527)-N(7))-methyltransferase RsmG [Ferrovibrio sp.]|uniref:16S rRNA (guanine(527)-N(7))-methyltransferase RsmG n=1 Tax=Ferrovibrio sp. TaxID=1917215 RepID=UPI0035AE61CB
MKQSPAQNPLSPETFAAEAGVSRETLDRLRIYAAQLVKWTKAINLVAPNTLPDLWRRHFLDSAQLYPLAADAPGPWLDLGSGAGFPGLVIAAMGRQVTLIESDIRKATFLRETARQMDVPAIVRAGRIEAVDPASLSRPAVISARALASLAELLDLAAPFMGPDTLLLFPKGRQAEDELTLARESWTIDHVEMIPSRSDPAGRIIRLKGLCRK